MPTAARGATLILLGALLTQGALAGTAAGYEPRDPATTTTTKSMPTDSREPTTGSTDPTTAPTESAGPTTATQPTPGDGREPTTGPTEAGWPTASAQPTSTPTSGPTTSAEDRPVAQPPAARSWSEVVKQVTETSPDDSKLRSASATEQPEKVLRCFKLEDENYCLGLGFVDRLPTGAELRTATALNASDSTAADEPAEQPTDRRTGDQPGDRPADSRTGEQPADRRSGDQPGEQPKVGAGIAAGALSPAEFVAERTGMPESARVNAELEEMQTAWDGRDKARALRLLSGQPAAGAETRASEPATPGPVDPPTPRPTPSSTPTPTMTAKPVPSSSYIMKGYQTSQEKGYWCGPATFQSIDWADDQQKDTQASWAKDLGTTTSGTAISAMVKQTNLKTSWDIAAGTYIVQSVGHWNTQKFFTVHQNHLGDGAPAPIIEHTQLLKRYFPYLAFNHSGHFQVGRGYNAKTGTIGIFEVFNERRFNSRGNITDGPKNIPASALFNATLANKFKNIGL